MIEFQKQIQKKFDTMQATGKLFRVALTGDQVWNLYIKSFTKEQDPKFRDPASTVHNCNHCNNFIRRYGNVVSINENHEIETMFDVVTTEEYQSVAIAMTNAIHDSNITEVFFETFDMLNSLPYESCKKTNAVFQLGVANNPKRYTKDEAALELAENKKHNEKIITLISEKEDESLKSKSVKELKAMLR